MSQPNYETNCMLAIEQLIKKILEAGRILKDSITYEETVRSKEDENDFDVQGTTLSKWLIILEKSEENISTITLEFLKTFSSYMTLMLDEANETFQEATEEERDKYYKLLDKILDAKKRYHDTQLKLENNTRQLQQSKSPIDTDAGIKLYNIVLKIIHEEINKLEKEFAEKYHKPTKMSSPSAIINEFTNAVQQLLLEPLGSSKSNMKFISKPDAMKRFLSKHSPIYSFINRFIDHLIKVNGYYLEFLKMEDQNLEVGKRYSPLSDDLLEHQPNRKKQKIEHNDDSESSNIVQLSQILNDPFADADEVDSLRKKLGLATNIKVLIVLPDGRIQLQKGKEELVWDHVDSMFHSYAGHQNYGKSVSSGKFSPVKI